MHILCGTVLRTSYPRIRNYTDSDRLQQGDIFDFQLPRHGIFVRRKLTQPQKLHSQLVGLMTAAMYQVAGLMCSFVYGMGLQPDGIIHYNLAGDAHHLLLFHVRPTNGVYLYHKKVRRLWFTDSRVNRYQPFPSFHYA